jgi:hypothetical protein
MKRKQDKNHLGTSSVLREIFRRSSEGKVVLWRECNWSTWIVLCCRMVYGIVKCCVAKWIYGMFKMFALIYEWVFFVENIEICWTWKAFVVSMGLMEDGGIDERVWQKERDFLYDWIETWLRWFLREFLSLRLVTTIFPRIRVTATVFHRIKAAVIWWISNGKQRESERIVFKSERIVFKSESEKSESIKSHQTTAAFIWERTVVYQQ